MMQQMKVLVPGAGALVEKEAPHGIANPCNAMIVDPIRFRELLSGQELP
jgi:hypothetical protein